MTLIAPAGDRTLDALHFDNAFARLGDAYSERRMPDGLPDTRLAAFSTSAAALIDLAPGEERRAEFLRIASGTAIVREMEPVAALYGGHQFGVWAGQLGDGRAMTLGTVINERGEPWEWQLKGAGMTAFSRFADGRAVVRSSIREFLCSEAMHHLGIPTTRALALTISSSEPVYRETEERAAIVSRLAPSFVRFGSFEIFQSRNDTAAIRTLADFVIDRYYPECGANDDRYERFFRAVVERTARLMAAWQSVGFAHGVMNTDNFSILGLTLDYGPFGFVEAYDPGFICNHTDMGGRYAFGRQPAVGLWNCYALANALVSLIEPARLEAVLERYGDVYAEAFNVRMAAKLGITVLPGDDPLVADWLALLAANRADFTNAHRALGDVTVASTPADDRVAQQFGDRGAFYAWFASYRDRIIAEARPDAERRAAMHAVNPRFVLRNHLAQDAIAASEAGNDAPLARLQAVLERPFDDQPGNEQFAKPAPDDRPPVVVSCSS